ncbi:MAG TPA: histidine kinase, partial [Nitrospira sp.]|nr:histidine kinase [Nitrospira sp.]
VLSTDAMARWPGGPGPFGTPTGAVATLTITPESRQAMARIYAMLPILPTAPVAMHGYHIVWRQVQRMRERERELTELAATAQLAALRAQINPHFLFNSLNSIAQLIHADPDKAEACVERLAQMFRYILHTNFVMSTVTRHPSRGTFASLLCFLLQRHLSPWMAAFTSTESLVAMA